MALTHPTTPFLNFRSRCSESQNEKFEISNGTHALGLPTDFPPYISSNLAWSAAQFRNEEQYVYYLTVEDKLEIDAALQSFQGAYTSVVLSYDYLSNVDLELGLDGNLVNRSNFPLPQFRISLQHIAEDVHYGKGFCVIRGLETERYSVEDSTVIFLGIQSYIADQRMRQDELGNMISKKSLHPFTPPQQS
jgi:hypothetical protein